MIQQSLRTALLSFVFVWGVWSAAEADIPQIQFDHIHAYAEVVAYLNEVVDNYPEIAQLNKIGESYLGKALWCSRSPTEPPVKVRKNRLLHRREPSLR